MRRSSIGVLAGLVLALAAAACAPAAPPSPTALPPKPAATAAPAKQEAKPEAAAPAAKPAPTQAPAAAPTEKPPAKVESKAVEEFYRGKTIRMLVSTAAGGTYDLTGRLVAKHLSQFIPGNPTVIVENKTGAGGILATNLVYNSEPKDGTVILLVSETVPLQQAIGTAGVQFDAGKFNWLGSFTKTSNACMVRTGLGVERIEDVIGGKEVVIGTTPPGVSIHDAPAAMNAALDTRFKLIPGYGGAAEIRQALDRKEVDGMCITVDSIAALDLERLQGDKPSARVLVTMGSRTSDLPFMKGVPAAEPLAKTEAARQLLRTVDAPAQMGRPLLVAPEVPKERVEALRKAVAQTAANPQFLAEADKAKFMFEFTPGETVGRIVQEVLNVSPATLAKLQEIMK
ncbi:MAG: hypothetical protein HY690_01890 [Chloroflexi bacterium]|nr:hypothetical protein [Chloroflexota bacterium]